MLRKIIKIDESKCNGCGACASACHEGAIGMVNGKAKLLREDYCDGLGDCLPACPTNAITFEEREAPEYNHEAVMASKAKKAKKVPFVCPGSMAKAIHHEDTQTKIAAEVPGHLSQWPVQIRLLPTRAPYYENADILVAADCTAYAYGNFHDKFIKGKITMIGCPKLDDIAYYEEKIKQILMFNSVKSVTVARMQVPCCGGIENAVKNAIAQSGKDIPLKVVTITHEGKIL